MDTWASRVKELKSSGMTFGQIGGLVGLAASSVSDIAYGLTKEPRGDAALALYDLHKSKCVDLIKRKRA